MVAWWFNGNVSGLNRVVVGLIPGRDTCQVATAWIGDCLQTGKPSWYITNTKVNSAFHPTGVGKSSTSLYGWG